MSYARLYKVTTNHTYLKKYTGDFILEVYSLMENTIRYVNGIFGCSRDLYTSSDEIAIKRFLSESSTEVLNITYMGEKNEY